MGSANSSDFGLSGNFFGPSHPVGLSDLYMFDPHLLKWTRLDQDILGFAPIGRYDAGFAAVGSWFCLFGGIFSRSSGNYFFHREAAEPSLEKPRHHTNMIT